MTEQSITREVRDAMKKKKGKAIANGKMALIRSFGKFQAWYDH